MNTPAFNRIDVMTKIQHIYDRLGWTITRGELGSLLGVTSRSVEIFKERIGAEVIKKPELNNIIDDYWVDLIQSGNKVAKIYSYKNKRNELIKIRNYLYSQKRRSGLPYWQNFPYPLDNDELMQCDNRQRFYSIHEYDLDGRVIDVALFISTEKYTATFDVEMDHLSDSGKELLESSVDIVYRKRAVTQCYNTVIVDLENEIIIMSVDFSKLPKTETTKQFAGLKRYVARSGIRLPEPINLFPAVSELYSIGDGRISMVSFITSDGNASSLSLKGKQECLKRDAYHQGGEIASGIITKFKIEKLWDMQLRGGYLHPIGVALLGKKAMLDSVSEKLSDAIIVDNTELKHQIFIIDKLMEALE